jgi:arylformamidase
VSSAAGTPRVYLDYDQAALDAAYDQAVYAPNREQIHERNVANSDAARALLGQPQRIAYGSGPSEFFDFYRTTRASAPLFIFVHGGAWRTTGIERYGFAALPFVTAGIHFAAVQFDGVDQTRGDLMALVHQVRRAVAFIHANAPRLGADSRRITIGGHSSGAHLTSAVLLTDWTTFGAPAGLLKAAICCSGMYDLYPVSLSQRSSYVRFDDVTIESLSAQRHIARVRCPVVVCYGTYESPEFQRQARDFAEKLRAAGKLADLVVGTGYNHFELIETIGNPHGVVGRVALKLAGA